MSHSAAHARLGSAMHRLSRRAHAALLKLQRATFKMRHRGTARGKLGEKVTVRRRQRDVGAQLKGIARQRPFKTRTAHTHEHVNNGTQQPNAVVCVQQRKTGHHRPMFGRCFAQKTIISREGAVDLDLLPHGLLLLFFRLLLLLIMMMIVMIVVVVRVPWEWRQLQGHEVCIVDVRTTLHQCIEKERRLVGKPGAARELKK